MATQDEGKRAREQDPEVIAERHRKFDELVMPNVRFVEYICVRYCVEPNEQKVTELKWCCLIHLYRVICSFDSSKYKDPKNHKRALQNWIHLVCKRLIKKWNETYYAQLSLVSEHDDVDDENIWDGDDGALVATENTGVVITMQNYRQFLSDKVLYAFEHLDIIQQESFLMKYNGMAIADIYNDQVAKGRISPKSGFDSVKKRMQRGRVVLAKYMAEYDDIAKRKVVKEAKGSDPGNNKEDEFELNF